MRLVKVQLEGVRVALIVLYNMNLGIRVPSGIKIWFMLYHLGMRRSYHQLNFRKILMFVRTIPPVDFDSIRRFFLSNYKIFGGLLFLLLKKFNAVYIFNLLPHF